jgi:dTDP-L-rhamnose 4-epimerase
VTGAAYGIPTVALRFFNVYGPGQALSNPYTGVAAIFASRLMNGRPPVIFEDGAQSRDFIHVSDIVEGLLLALASEEAVGYALNLGTGRSTSVEEIGRLLAEGLSVEHAPERPMRFRAGDIRHCFSDRGEARRRLGFEAKVTLEEGMTDLLEWLSGREAVDHVDQATDELMSRGLAR